MRMAEWNGTLQALMMAWNYRIDKLFIESDSIVSIGLIKVPLLPTHHYATILREIKAWLQRDWQVKIIHTYKEGNCG